MIAFIPHPSGVATQQTTYTARCSIKFPKLHQLGLQEVEMLRQSIFAKLSDFIAVSVSVTAQDGIVALV